MLQLLIELDERAQAITERDISRSHRRLPVLSNGKVLETVHSEGAKRWWALSDILTAESDSHEHTAAYDAETDIAQTEAERATVRSRHMANVAREVAWATAREDIGGAAWDKDMHVYMSTGWQLVGIKVPRGQRGGGGIAALPDLLRGVGLSLRDHEPEEEEDGPDEID